MRSGVAAVQNTLTPPAQNVLRHAIHNAQGRGHTHVQPLHVALVLLSHGGPLLRQACTDLHTQALHGLQQCHALELCFNIALDRLPQSSSSSNTHPLALSNALVAALKRAQAHQKRGCPEQQQPPLVAVKVEIEQLIISILEDPSVSRVMKEAGFVSQQVKTNLENAISLSGSLQQGKGNHYSQKPFASDLEPPLVGCMGARPPILPSPWIPPERTEDQKLLCCPECMSLFNAECKQLQAQETAQAEVVVTPLPSWLQKEKDIKSEQEKCHSLSQKLQDLQQKWQFFCRTSHSARDMALGLLPPHSRMDHNVPNNTDRGLMATNSTPVQSVDFASLPTPKPSQALNRLHWTRSLASIAPPESPRSIHGDVIGSKSQGLENVGKQATLVSEESGNKIDKLQLGGSRPIEQGRPNPSPLSRLHANLPKSSTSGCPLRSPLSSPLSALKASKPLSKSPLMANFPLAQKLPPKSMNPLSQPLDTSLKNDKPPAFFDQKAAERLKHVYKGLLEKVSWQSHAISQIATALVNAQSGKGKLRGLAARADTWLLLLGPDQVGKRLVADALAELVIGIGKGPVCFGLIQQDKDLPFSKRWGRKDQDEVQQRGRTTLDSVADALRTNPLCVLLLEEIDQADSVLRMNLARAMETGKFMDSSSRQVNVGNAIILMTSKVGTNSISGISKDNLFLEEKLSLLHGARMKLVISPPVEKEVILRGDHKISVVKDTTSAPVVDDPVNLLATRMAVKRKPSGFLKQALLMHSEKRPKLVAPTGRTLPLDLNLSAEENEAEACQEERASSNQESKASDSDPVVNAAQQALSPSFFNLVDNAVVFEPFDMMGQANWVLSQLSSACSGQVCTRVEVDFQLLEHMVGITWRTPGGNQAFLTWVQEKLKSSLNAFTGQSDVLGDRVLRFVYEDRFSKELCSASELPLQIEVGNR